MKLISEKDLLKKAQKSITSALSDIAFVEIKESKANVRIDNKKIDFVLSTLVSGKPAKVIVEVKS